MYCSNCIYCVTDVYRQNYCTLHDCDPEQVNYCNDKEKQIWYE